MKKEFVNKGMLRLFLNSIFKQNILRYKFMSSTPPIDGMRDLESLANAQLKGTYSYQMPELLQSVVQASV